MGKLIDYCDACNLFPARWGNKRILGSDHRICKRCFADWYDGGITNPTTMALRRQKEVNEFYKPKEDDNQKVCTQ